MPMPSYEQRERDELERRAAARQAEQEAEVAKFRKYARYGLIGGAALVALIAVASTTYTVDQKELAVLTTNGAFTAVEQPGRHFKLPVFQSVSFYHTGTQSIAVDNVEAYTVDNQPVMISFQVQFNIDDATEVERLFKHFGSYQTRMQSIAIDRTKIAFGTRQIADVPSERGKIEHEVLEVVASETRRLYGLDVTEFQLQELHYSQAFQNATDQMAIAKAQVQQAEQQRLQAQKNAERVQIDAEGQAQAAIAQAHGQAESLSQVAQAEANATRLKGEAEADAIKAQAAALGASPNFVAFKQASQWDGKLPTTILGGDRGALPILNVGK